MQCLGGEHAKQLALRRDLQEYPEEFREVKSGQIILIDVEGDEGKETFTFKGMARETLPDTPEDLAEAPTA